MKRIVAVVVMAIAMAASLSGCGGGSAYCDAIDKDKATLNTFGEKRTNADYDKYAKVFARIGKLAPKSAAKDWTKISDVTKDVIAAQKQVGLKLEEMTDTAKVKKLSQAELKKLNAAYEAFNGTSAQRNAVVKNAKQECKITLK